MTESTRRMISDIRKYEMDGFGDSDIRKWEMCGFGYPKTKKTYFFRHLKISDGWFRKSEVRDDTSKKYIGYNLVFFSREVYCKRYKETTNLIRITAKEYYRHTNMRGEALVAGAGICSLKRERGNKNHHFDWKKFTNGDQGRHQKAKS